MLVGRRTLPSLGDSVDVAEFLTKSGYGSVSLDTPVDVHMSHGQLHMCHANLPAAGMEIDRVQVSQRSSVLSDIQREN